MRWTTKSLLVLLFLTPVSIAQEKLWKPADDYALATIDLAKQSTESRYYLRYISRGNTKTADRIAMGKAVSFVVNSLSRSVVITQPKDISDTLQRIDLRDYKIPVTAWEKLGQLGSGRTPQPEPYYHRELETVIEETEEYGRWEYPGGVKTWVKTRDVPTGKKISKKVQAHGGWLRKADVIYLTSVTESQFPVLRADWFITNATQEPRYHELLDVGDKESDFAKLGAADEKAAEEEGAQARGAVLFSEVAPNNRILERTPTIRLYGRGWYWKSFDFASSTKLEDVLADINGAMTDKAGAHEIITSLKNGLQAYSVTDDKGKRLDRAGIEFARDLKNGFRSPEVEIRNCMVCHSKGMISVDDEVRALAKGPLAAAASVLGKKDERKAEKFLEKYAAAPLDDLLKTDSANFELAVKSTNGLSGAANGQGLLKMLLQYEGPMTLADIARDVGCTEADAKVVIPLITNPDHTLSAAWVGRKVRRDQVEGGGYSQLAEALEARKK